MKPRQIKKNSKLAMDLLIKLFKESPEKFSLESNEVISKNNKPICFMNWVLWFNSYEDSDYKNSADILTELILWNHSSWNKIERHFNNETNCPEYPISNFTFNELIKECRELAKAGVKFK